MSNAMKLADIAAAISATVGVAETAMADAEKEGLVPLLKLYYALKEGYALLDTARKEVYALLDKHEKFVLPKMFDEGDLDLVRIPELARSFYPQTKYSAAVGDKDKLFAWLRELGQGELISETVNSSTLAGFLKSKLLDEGIEAPEEIARLTSYKAIGSSKYTPK